jgi:lysocardiolipin and lysophospholipid acyltransferase
LYILYTHLELVYGVNIVISEDTSVLKSPCLIVMNHRTRFDWLFLWCYLIRKGDLNRGKVILKKQLKHVFGYGWAMQVLLFIFLSRDWTSDEAYLHQMFGHFVESKYPLQLLIFPEGTDLSESNKAKSQKYAEENNLTKYEQVLHPRTKGFVLCVNDLKRLGLQTIASIDIAYKGSMPQNERDLIQGKWPNEVHFRVENFALNSLPNSDSGLAEWLQGHWEEKEKRLEEFYRKGQFQSNSCETDRPLLITFQMTAIILFWICVFAFGVYTFVLSWWAVGYFVGVLLFFWAIDRVFGGFDNLELLLSKRATPHSD